MTETCSGIIQYGYLLYCICVGINSRTVYPQLISRAERFWTVMFSSVFVRKNSGVGWQLQEFGHKALFMCVCEGTALLLRELCVCGIAGAPGTHCEVRSVTPYKGSLPSGAQRSLHHQEPRLKYAVNRMTSYPTWFYGYRHVSLWCYI